MTGYAKPETIDEKESLEREIERANERCSEIQRLISKYIDYLEPFEAKEGMENDWNEVEKNNRGDDYSEAWLNYTIKWAKLMQNLQKTIILNEDIIRETSFLADTYGITGFMHEAAVSALKKYWKYGDIFETGTKNVPSDALTRLESYANSLEKAGMMGYANSIRDCVKELRWERR